MSAKPTICHVLHSLQVGGAEVLAAGMARRLRSDFRFLFVCLDHLGDLGTELRAEGFPVEVLGRQPGVDFSCAARFGGLLRQHDVSLIHAHQYTPFFYSTLARYRYRRPAILFTEHGRHYPDVRRPKRIWANRLLLEKRDRVIGVGAAVRDALITNEGLKPDRVAVIYNGIDLSRFSANDEDSGTIRAELGLSPDDFVIFFVARLDPVKDHATALRAVDKLRKSVPRAQLIIVGEGPQQSEITRLIQDLQLESNVKLLGLRQDVPRLLAAADCLLLTSVSEGIPLTIIEAMAAGLPVVATNVGGVAEVVVDQHTGYLHQAGDDGAIAASLQYLSEHPDHAQDLGHQGQHRAHERFSQQAMDQHYRELYYQMLPS